MRVRSATSNSCPPRPSTPRTLSLGGCNAWLDGDVLTLAEAGDAKSPDAASPALRSWLHGTAQLNAGEADIQLAGSPPGLEGALTITAALLLGRAKYALMHCGAIVSPEGHGWLIVGDAHSGKSTLTAGAIVAGWRYASDDQCVLHAGRDSSISAIGWPRDFHLDEGWKAGTPTGVRRTVDADRDLGEGRWQSTVRVSGVVMPAIARDEPTALAPTTRSTVLAALIRQSPWLAADPVVARDMMALLERVAALPSFTLRMGLDSYADRSILSRRLHDLEGLARKERALAPA